MFDVLRQDIRDATRTLKNSPLYTAIVTVTLALGVGAITAVFSVTRQVLLKELDVARPHELVEIGCINPATADGDCNVSYPGYLLFSANREVVDGLFAYWTAGETSLWRDGRAEIVTGLLVSGNMYSVLGLQAPVGRLLTAADDRPDAPAVAVLGYDYWQRAFGGTTDVVGRALRLNNQSVTVVGVTPASFRGISVGYVPDVTLPLAAAEQFRSRGALANGGDTFLKMIGRRKQGVADEEIQRRLAPVFAATNNLVLTSLPPSLAASVRTMVSNYRFVVRSARLGASSQLRDDLTTPLRILALVVGGVLVIACANLGALLISRVSARRRELAIRLALGASTARITRQLALETGMLALMGTGGALTITWWVLPTFVTLLAGEQTLRTIDLRLDPVLLGFAAATAIAAMLLIACGAAVHTSRVDAAEVARGPGGSRRTPVSSRMLVAAQCAVTVLLLVTAGLLIRTLDNLLRVDTGFGSDRRVVATVRPDLAGYDPVRTRTYIDEVVKALESEPGVRRVTYSRYEMGALNSRTVVSVRGGKLAAADEPVGMNRVGPGFVETAGLQLLAGRDIQPGDALAAAPAAIVNEAFAKQFVGTVDAIGRQLSVTGSPTAYSIVGVVRTARDRGVAGVTEPVAYLPYARGADLRSVTITAHIDQDPSTAVGAVVRTLAAVDPTVPVQRVDTLAARLNEGLRRHRLIGGLSAALGVLALVLVATGMYGMLSGVVTRRRTEIAIRTALGATRAMVAWTLTREALPVVAFGVAIGLAGAMAIMPSIKALLFGVEPLDPFSISAAVGILFAVCLIGLLAPLRRATAIEPASALKIE